MVETSSIAKETPLHENSHAIVRDNETGKDVGVLTSANDSKKEIFIALRIIRVEYYHPAKLNHNNFVRITRIVIVKMLKIWLKISKLLHLFRDMKKT
jgi:hypothetical protein